MVVRDWREEGAATVTATCVTRDFPRLVLTRDTEDGPERLYLDPESGLPVKLDREERDEVWGQHHVEFLYSTWITVDDRMLAGSSFRVVDGMVEISRTVGNASIMDGEEEPPTLELATGVPEIPSVLEALPDIVPVTENLNLLVTRAYTEAVALVGDTLFVFDATTEEGRALGSRQRIEELHLGAYPAVVVVTDLAWPHIGGVRTWVAHSAEIVSHETSEPLLQRLVDRPWTREPDLLEQRRDQASFRFTGVREGASRAGGRVLLATIGGIGSEGALIAFLPETGFLWASDYIQTVSRPSTYAAEVIAAVQREGWVPTQVAAQHLEFTAWQEVLDANP